MAELLQSAGPGMIFPWWKRLLGDLKEEDQAGSPCLIWVFIGGGGFPLAAKPRMAAGLPQVFKAPHETNLA